MSAVPFDTLKLADRLQAGGFTAEQAHTFASALAETAAGADLATRQDLGDMQGGIKHDISTLEAAVKRDISALETAVKRDISTLEVAVKRDISALETAVKRDLVELEQRLTIRLGGMLVVLAGVLSAVFRYLR